MPVTVPVGNNVPSAANGVAMAGDPTSYTDNQNWIGWQDVIIPGYTALNNMFDFTGKQAAAAQASSQFALDNAARAFSANEAQKQRDWEEYMSNTSIQRQVADLKSAGLPAWLALNRGLSGASTPSGSSATSQSGQASKADNKLAIAAGIFATALRIFLTKH